MTRSARGSRPSSPGASRTCAAAAAPATVRLALPEGVLALSRTLTVESGLARWSSDGRSLRWQGTLAGGARSGLRFALRPAPELRPAGEGPVAELVVAELAAAADDQRRLVVYVGASWCEPCVAFHEAIAAGRIGAPLGGARFLEFDLDRDGDRLREAGYTSRLIPLFVVPEADGRAGSRRTEGGIKGPGAVDNLVRRLGPLLKD